MKKYVSFLEQEGKDIDVTSQITGIQDSIKKLEFQNKEDGIDIKYMDKKDPEYNKKINDARERIKGRQDSIQVLKDRIQAIKNQEAK